MNGRRISFLILHCFWWGHQRTYPWARCEWCLHPGEVPTTYGPMLGVPVDEPIYDAEIVDEGRAISA